MLDSPTSDDFEEPRKLVQRGIERADGLCRRTRGGGPCLCGSALYAERPGDAFDFVPGGCRGSPCRAGAGLCVRAPARASCDPTCGGRRRFVASDSGDRRCRLPVSIGGGRNTVRGCPFPHFFSCAGLRTELGTRSSQFRKIHRELENSEAKNCILQNFRYICTPDSRIFDIRYARMAESVDALVSNTNDSNVVPVRPRLRVLLESLK